MEQLMEQPPWKWTSGEDSEEMSEDEQQQVTSAFMKSTQLSADEAQRILSAYQGNLHLALEYFYSFRTWVTNGVCRCLAPDVSTHAS
jgi:hypothetical protein